MKLNMKLSDIKISKCFERTIPKEYKMQECRDFWDKHHDQDRYVIVNKDNVLIDGYIQYLVLKENNIEEAEIKVAKHHNIPNCRKPLYRSEPTVYVFGKHWNKKLKRWSKEYAWRIPQSWSLNRISEITIGDKVLVDTKFGFSPIVITRMEILAQCPVDTNVRKVIKKL